MDAKLNARVHDLLGELRNLQDELSHPARDQKSGMASPKLPLETTQQLQSAVDALRLFLWAYLDTYSGNLAVEEKLQQIRTEATADMLCLLDAKFRTGGVPHTPQAQRLCHQIVGMNDLAAVVVGRQ